MIHPSPALITSQDTPISECVALMNRNNIGSVLIVSDDLSQRLVGIFTERDVVKNIELIQKGSYWSFPVHSVMSRKLITIELKHLDRAPQVMLDHAIRHLPVVVSKSDGSMQLIGVVSMRDLFKRKFESPAWKALLADEITPKSNKPTLAQIYSTDTEFVAVARGILKKLIRGVVLQSAEELPSSISGDKPLILLDADRFDIKEVTRFLKISLARNGACGVGLLYDPAHFSKAALTALERLKDTGKVGLFPKPINLLALSEFIGSRLN